MTQNPLQSYFRQTKIYVKLPSNGVYSSPGAYQGDLTNMPVFGMTGMDEILMKTPDALFTSESTVQVIESCCPFIKNGWEVSNLDLDLILASIRIATFGNILEVTHNCTSCNTENDYSLDVSNIIDHFLSYQYDNMLVLDKLTVKLRPLTYRQSTDFSLKNYEIQQKFAQVKLLDDVAQQQTVISELFKLANQLQFDIILACIESIDTGLIVVKELQFIAEWLNNSDADIVAGIKDRINKMKELATIPSYKVHCEECNAENSIIIELDQASFFARA